MNIMLLKNIVKTGVHYCLAGCSYTSILTLIAFPSAMLAFDKLAFDNRTVDF